MLRGVGVILLVLWGILGTAVPTAWAQTQSGTVAEALTSEERSLRVTVRPTYQRLEDNGRELDQWSVPVEIVVPFREQWQLRIEGGAATVGGENYQSLSGLTDVRAALGYAVPVGTGSVVVNANVNAPTGQETLTRGELATAALVSQNFYRFRVSSFGRGPGAGGGATWAVPVGETVVLGVGGAFQYYGSYTPVAGLEQEYDPGHEGRLTAGVDFRLTQVSALSVEASLFLYGTDTMGGVDRFNVGNQGSVRVRYLRQGDDQTIRILGTYREQQRSTVPVGGGTDQRFQALPSHGALQGKYTSRLSEIAKFTVSAAGHWYDATTAFESKTFATVGLESRLEVAEGVSIVPRAAFVMGDVVGGEGGLGISVRR
jgi:hypothetical protein